MLRTACLILTPLAALAQPSTDLERFAASVLNQLQGPSFSGNIELCGYIGLQNGRLTATQMARGATDYCDSYDPPAGFEPLASVHTHGAWSPDADAEIPSVDDVLGDIEEGVDGFVATPGGRFWYVDGVEGTVELICGVGCLQADPNFRPCPAFAPGAYYDIDGLEERIDNDPGHC